MKSFLIILVFLMFGFTLIFYQFDRDTPFMDHFFVIVDILYNNADAEAMSTSQKIFYVIESLLLALILLNMLIAMMADTYQKVQSKSVLAEGREKISLIIESTSLMRAFKKIFSKEKVRKKVEKESQKVKKRIRRKNSFPIEEVPDITAKDNGKGYLFYVQTVDKEYDPTTNFFEWDSQLKRYKRRTENTGLLALGEDITETGELQMQCKELKTILEDHDIRLKTLETIIKTNFEELDKKIKYKMDEILTCITDGTPTQQVFFFNS